MTEKSLHSGASDPTPDAFWRVRIAPALSSHPRLSWVTADLPAPDSAPGLVVLPVDSRSWAKWDSIPPRNGDHPSFSRRAPDLESRDLGHRSSDQQDREGEMGKVWGDREA